MIGIVVGLHAHNHTFMVFTTECVFLKYENNDWQHFNSWEGQSLRSIEFEEEVALSWGISRVDGKDHLVKGGYSNTAIKAFYKLERPSTPISFEIDLEAQCTSCAPGLCVVKSVSQLPKTSEKTVTVQLYEDGILKSELLVPGRLSDVTCSVGTMGDLVVASRYDDTKLWVVFKDPQGKVTGSHYLVCPKVIVSNGTNYPRVILSKKFRWDKQSQILTYANQVFVRKGNKFVSVKLPFGVNNYAYEESDGSTKPFNAIAAAYAGRNTILCIGDSLLQGSVPVLKYLVPAIQTDEKEAVATGMGIGMYLGDDGWDYSVSSVTRQYNERWDAQFSFILSTRDPLDSPGGNYQVRLEFGKVVLYRVPNSSRNLLLKALEPSSTEQVYLGNDGLIRIEDSAEAAQENAELYVHVSLASATMHWITPNGKFLLSRTKTADNTAVRLILRRNLYNHQSFGDWCIREGVNGECLDGYRAYCSRTKNGEEYVDGRCMCLMNEEAAKEIYQNLDILPESTREMLVSYAPCVSSTCQAPVRRQDGTIVDTYVANVCKPESIVICSNVFANSGSVIGGVINSVECGGQSSKLDCNDTSNPCPAGAKCVDSTCHKLCIASRDMCDAATETCSPEGVCLPSSTAAPVDVETPPTGGFPAWVIAVIVVSAAMICLVATVAIFWFKRRARGVRLDDLQTPQ